MTWSRAFSKWAPPFSPFVEALGEYARTAPAGDVESMPPRVAAVLARIIPALKDRLPHLEEPPPLAAEGERYRLLEAVSDTLGRIAERRPTVLVLDDLHWADKGTIAMLRHVAAATAATPVLVVGAYRDVELDRQHPLAAALTDLRRGTSFTRIALAGLAPGDIGQMMDVIAEQSVPRSLVDAIARETNGNPFFIKEVLLHLVEEQKVVHQDGRWITTLSVAEMGIPEGLREVIGRRLSRLSDGCNVMLRTVCAMTGGFSWPELQATCASIDTPFLLDALDEALRAQILIEPLKGDFDFTHALIRHTLYGELSTPRRLLLHRRIGEALEALYAGDTGPHIAELAHHFFEAATGSDERAITYSERAAERARTQLAYDEAAHHYRNALHLLDLGGGRDDARRCDILLSLAEERWHANDWRRAEEAVREAVPIARSLGSASRLARAAIAASGRWFFFFGQPPAEHMSLMEEAIAAVGDTDEGLRAHLLARTAANILFVPEAAGIRAVHMTEAIDIARRLGDRRTLAYALAHQHIMLPDGADPRDRLSLATEATTLAEEAGDLETTMMARLLLCEDHMAMGDMDRFDEDFALATALDDTLHLPAISGFLRGLRVARAVLAGAFAEAESLASDDLQRNLAATLPGEQTGAWLQIFGVQILSIRRETGGLAGLEPAVRAAVEQFPTPAYRAALAALYADLGREEEARTEFEIIAGPGLDTIPDDMFWTATLALLSETCHYLGDVARAALIYAALSAVRPRNVLVGRAPPFMSLGSTSRHLGLLASTLGLWSDGERHFGEAIAMHERMRAPAWLARARYDYANMLMTRGDASDHDRAATLLAGAVREARDLGMEKLLADSERLAAALR